MKPVICFLLISQLLVAGCSFTLADVNVGASAGTAFDDPFNWGKRTYQVNISGHYVRDRMP